MKYWLEKQNQDQTKRVHQEINTIQTTHIGKKKKEKKNALLTLYSREWARKLGHTCYRRRK